MTIMNISGTHIVCVAVIIGMASYENARAQVSDCVDLASNLRTLHENQSSLDFKYTMHKLFCASSYEEITKKFGTDFTIPLEVPIKVGIDKSDYEKKRNDNCSSLDRSFSLYKADYAYKSYLSNDALGVVAQCLQRVTNHLKCEFVPRRPDTSGNATLIIAWDLPGEAKVKKATVTPIESLKINGDNATRNFDALGNLINQNGPQFLFSRGKDAQRRDVDVFIDAEVRIGHARLPQSCHAVWPAVLEIPPKPVPPCTNLDERGMCNRCSGNADINGIGGFKLPMIHCPNLAAGQYRVEFGGDFKVHANVPNTLFRYVLSVGAKGTDNKVNEKENVRDGNTSTQEYWPFSIIIPDIAVTNDKGTVDAELFIKQCDNVGAKSCVSRHAVWRVCSNMSECK